MANQKLSELPDANSVGPGDNIYVLDSSDGLSSKKLEVQGFSPECDIFWYGAVSDATFLSGLQAAIVAGERSIVVSRDYTVDMSAHLIGITIPLEGIHFTGINNAKITFTGGTSGELFKGTAGSTGGTIKFENLHIVTDGTDRVTLVDFDGMTLIDDLIITGCRLRER